MLFASGLIKHRKVANTGWESDRSDVFVSGVLDEMHYGFAYHGHFCFLCACRCSRWQASRGEGSLCGMLLSRSSLLLLLVTISLSTLTLLLRFATGVGRLSSLPKHAGATQSAHTAEPASDEMQYLSKLGELFYPETPPARSETPVQTTNVIQQEDPRAAKQPGFTRFVCLSDTHGLHSDAHSSSKHLKVGPLVSPAYLI